MSRTAWIHSASVALVLAGAGGCATQNQGKSLADVDQFVTAIERVHTGSELAQEKLHGALLELHALVSLDFGDDVVGAYGAAATAVDASGKQLLAFDQEVKKMKSLADPVFKRWAADLDTFTSLELRLRSQNRLAQTRERYDAIVTTVEPAQVAFVAVQKQLADCVLFLKHDLNAASAAALRQDVARISTATQTLDAQLLACQSAAQEYVAAVALPSVPEPAVEPAPAPAAPAPAAAPAKKGTSKPATTKPATAPKSVAPPRSNS